jgi:hypothetical protein
MRLGLMVAVAIWVPAAVWPVKSFAQSLLGNAQGDQGGAVAVPPAPPIVPSPPAAPMPSPPAATMTGTPDQSAPSQTAPMQLMPVQATPIQATPLPAAPLQAAPSQAAPLQAAPLQAAPLQAAPMPQVIQTAQPPGQVETPVPPADQDDGQAQAVQAAPASGQPDGTQAASPPAAPGPAAPSQAAPSQTAPDTADSTPPPVPNDWVPEKTAEIGILDKVDGGASTVSVPVGGQTTAGDLQISVLACVARPPNEVPDDAVFLDIQPTDNSSGGPIFRGWMIRSIPGATVVGNASETLRVVSCS